MKLPVKLPLRPRPTIGGSPDPSPPFAERRVAEPVRYLPPMSRRQLLAALLGLLTAAGCVRLGLWQLDRLRHVRLDERPQGRAPLGAAVAPLRPDLRHAPLPARHRHRHLRLRSSGRARRPLEQRIARRGPHHPDAPPTPAAARSSSIAAGSTRRMRRPCTLREVRRDAAHDDHRLRAKSSRSAATGPARTASTPNAWRRLDVREIEQAFPFQIAPFYIVAQPDSGAAAAPRRTGAPPAAVASMKGRTGATPSSGSPSRSSPWWARRSSSGRTQQARLAGKP